MVDGDLNAKILVDVFTKCVFLNISIFDARYLCRYNKGIRWKHYDGQNSRHEELPIHNELTTIFFRTRQVLTKGQVYNNGRVIGDWYTKTNAIGGRKPTLVSNALSTPGSVFLLGKYKQIEDFKERMRARAKHISINT